MGTETCISCNFHVSPNSLFFPSFSLDHLKTKKKTCWLLSYLKTGSGLMRPPGAIVCEPLASISHPILCCFNTEGFFMHKPFLFQILCHWLVLSAWIVILFLYPASAWLFKRPTQRFFLGVPPSPRNDLPMHTSSMTLVSHSRL